MWRNLIILFLNPVFFCRSEALYNRAHLAPGTSQSSGKQRMLLIRFNLSPAHATIRYFQHTFGFKTFTVVQMVFLLICSFLFSASRETLFTHKRGKRDIDIFGLDFLCPIYSGTLWKHLLETRLHFESRAFNDNYSRPQPIQKKMLEI